MHHRSHDWGSASVGSASRVVGQTFPRDTWDITGYGQQAGGMHPTVMHSCLKYVVITL